jgi:hypothetical protein
VLRFNNCDEKLVMVKGAINVPQIFLCVAVIKLFKHVDWFQSYDMIFFLKYQEATGLKVSQAAMFNKPLTNSCVKLNLTFQNPLLTYSHNLKVNNITFKCRCCFNDRWKAATPCSSCHIYHTKIRIK